MMKSAGKKAREVDLADFNLDKIEALDPSNSKGEHKVLTVLLASLNGRFLPKGNIPRRHQFSNPLHRTGRLEAHPREAGMRDSQNVHLFDRRRPGVFQNRAHKRIRHFLLLRPHVRSSDPESTKTASISSRNSKSLIASSTTTQNFASSSLQR